MRWNEQINILLIEDDLGDADLLQDMLVEKQGHAFKLVWVDRFQAGLDHLAGNEIDLVLLDLSLPDAPGLAGCRRLHAQAPHLPIVVLGHTADETVAIQATQAGAQDYLLKEELDAHLLYRVIVYAVERKRSEGTLKKSLALIERAKQEWESTVDSLPQFVCLFDHLGRIARANRTVEHWGLAEVVEVKGRTLHELFHPGCVDPTCYLTSFWAEAWTALTQNRAAECEAEDKALRRYLHLHIQPISIATSRTDRPATSFGAAIIQDVTARKQAEAALRKAHDELEQRVKERTAHLSQANAALRQEIAKRRQVERERAHLYAETQNRARELAVLNRAGQAMASTLDLETVLEKTIAEANAIVEAARSTVLLSDPTADELIFAAAVGPTTDIMVGQRVPLHLSIAGWAARQKQSVWVEDAQRDPRFYEGIDAITGLTTRSILAVPLIFGDQVVGVIETTHKIKGDFTQHDLELLEALASSAAIAIANARLFEQVQVGSRQLRHLAQKVVSAHEEERQRLSHELHDEAGQALIVLKMKLEMMLLELPEEAEMLSDRLGETVAMTDMTMERLRMLARDLRPPTLDAAGLNPTLEGLCRDFARWGQLSISYDGSEPLNLSDSAKICLYRFLQEALTNVAKHAQAQQVWVKLQGGPDVVTLSVADDGRGFERQIELAASGQPQGLGLLGMQERLEILGGQLEIDSQPGQGTHLTAQLPVERS